MPSKRSHLVKTKIWKVSQLKYLGSILSSDNSVDAEVESRINRAAQVFRPLSRLVWYQSKINVHTKVKLFKSTILPTLLYGSETWNLLQHHIQRLQVFTNRCLRIITGTSLWEKMKNTQHRSKANIGRIDVMIQKRRLQWLGHLERMPADRLPKKLLTSKITDGRRQQDGRKQRWHDLVHKDLKTLNLVDVWKQEAHKRKLWRENITKRLHGLNRKKELEDKSKNSLACSFAECTKICANKAGLANHYRQIHQTQQTIRCEYCGQSFKHQGIHNHRKKCSTSNLLHLPHGG